MNHINKFFLIFSCILLGILLPTKIDAKKNMTSWYFKEITTENNELEKKEPKQNITCLDNGISFEDYFLATWDGSFGEILNEDYILDTQLSMSENDNSPVTGKAEIKLLLADTNGDFTRAPIYFMSEDNQYEFFSYQKLDSKNLSVKLPPGDFFGQKMAIEVNISNKYNEFKKLYIYEWKQNLPIDPVIKNLKPSDTDNIGRFVKIENNIDILEKATGSIIKAQADTLLFNEDEIISGENSSSVITFNDLSSVEIYEDSSIYLNFTSSEKHKLRLNHGKIWADISKRYVYAMQIEIPQATIIPINMSILTVEEKDGISIVKVFDGSVEYIGANGKSIVLQKGEMLESKLGIASKKRSFSLLMEYNNLSPNSQIYTKSSIKPVEEKAIKLAIGLILSIALIIALLLFIKKILKKRNEDVLFVLDSMPSLDDKP